MTAAWPHSVVAVVILGLWLVVVGRPQPEPGAGPDVVVLVAEPVVGPEKLIETN